jgi:hypothetical protein
MKKILPKELMQAIVPGTQTCISVYINKKTDLSSALEEIHRVVGNDIPQEEFNKLIYPLENFYALVPDELRTNLPLGVFITKNFAGYCQLPFEVKTIAAVAKSFHVKPLIKLMQKDRTYLLLQIDNHKVSHYTGDLSKLTHHETILFHNQKLITKK